jgi:predicted transcriptional regulator
VASISSVIGAVPAYVIHARQAISPMRLGAGQPAGEEVIAPLWRTTILGSWDRTTPIYLRGDPMSLASKVENVKRLRANELKWGVDLVAAGWTLMPSTILERQEALGLDVVDMNILMQLARYWWRADNPPHPKIKTIASCIQKSVSTVQRRITRMKNAGLIEVQHRHDDRHGGQTSSNYFFTGLIAAATEFAQEALQEKEANAAKKAARLKRKNPRSNPEFKVVDG